MKRDYLKNNKQDNEDAGLKKLSKIVYSIFGLLILLGVVAPIIIGIMASISDTTESASYVRSTTKTPSSVLSTSVSPTGESLKVSIKLSNTKYSQDPYKLKYATFYGTIENKGNVEVRYVKVRIKYNYPVSLSSTIEWTYAVGAEGLRPGENKSFDYRSTVDYAIKDMECEIIDYTTG